MTDRTQDRIRLAEAMGVEYRCNVDGTFYIGLPNPFEDANDDYAVLEYMRKNLPDFGRAFEWLASEWGSRRKKSEGWYSVARYQIGDYAEAALAVLKEKDGE
jgi:hypothetical protein